MAAPVICAVTAALLRGRTDTQAPPPSRPGQPPPALPGMFPLTVPGIGRLLANLHPPRPPGHTGHWTGRRRRQQARARRYHQRARLARDAENAQVSFLAAGLADVGRQVLIGGQELAPPRLVVTALAPGEVGGEILNVNLHPGPVGGEQAQRHASFLDDQDGLAAIGGQLGLDDRLVRLTRLRVGVAHREQQPTRGLARVHAPCAFPRAGDARVELAAEAQVPSTSPYQRARRRGSVSADHRSPISVS